MNYKTQFSSKCILFQNGTRFKVLAVKITKLFLHQIKFDVDIKFAANVIVSSTIHTLLVKSDGKYPMYDYFQKLRSTKQAYASSIPALSMDKLKYNLTQLLTKSNHTRTFFVYVESDVDKSGIVESTMTLATKFTSTKVIVYMDTYFYPPPPPIYPTPYTHVCN